MKTIVILLSSLMGFAGHASAKEQVIQVHCQSSTRVIAGSLDLLIKPQSKYLEYNFRKFHATSPAETYSISGNNQSGFGTSALSNSELSLEPGSEGDLQISASGWFYDRATPIGETHIDVSLGKTPYEALGGYSLDSFTVDGVEHQLGGFVSCRVSQRVLPAKSQLAKSCSVSASSDCSTGPKRICCECDAQGSLSCN